MRPREKYLLTGPDGFGDSDLVALVLETGCAGRAASHIARDVLDRVGGLAGLVAAPVPALSLVSGMGTARAVRVHAACELGRRLVAGGQVPPAVASAADAYAVFAPRMAALLEEELHGIFLNRRHAVLTYRVLTRGNDAHTIVDPRQVFRQAVLSGAAAVIVAHNHPSGDPTPSVPDVEVTSRLSGAGRLLGVDVLDHLVIAGSRFRSLREEGFIQGQAFQGTVVASSAGLPYGSYRTSM